MEVELPPSFLGVPFRAVFHVLGGGTKLQDKDFDIGEASMGIGCEVFLAGVAWGGDPDVPIVLVH